MCQAGNPAARDAVCNHPKRDQRTGSPALRVTDHRYSRDLERHHLALRMIRHEARTCTIRSCTTLTDDRIRKLYRSYVAEGTASRAVRRKRGKSPRRAGYFLRNASAHLEASLLAGLFTAVGLIEGEDARGPARHSLEFGALFCDAFETYQSLWRSGCLSFEHAWFLLIALASGEDLKVDGCPECGGAFVRDTLALAPGRCPLCRMKTDTRGVRRLLAERRRLADPRT